uniref:Rab-GAP TBC domain-containing protein n=1 Tax=Arcella intermedia TaxID=1963864 RepID=A0A6B2L074_9EUKA
MKAFKDYQSFRMQCRLNDEDKFEDSIPNCKFEMEQYPAVSGVLCVSEQVFGFLGQSSTDPFWFVAPFREVLLKLSEVNPALVLVKSSNIEFSIKFPGGLSAQNQKRTLLELWKKAADTPISKPLSFLLEQELKERVYPIYVSVDEAYFQKQRLLEEQWEKFFSVRKFGRILIRDKKLVEFVHQGVPDSKRGVLWQVLSGSSNSQMLKEQNYYENLLESHRNLPSLAAEDIDKDVKRSFPQHPYFKSPVGLTKLRNVLLAYSWHNESVGYCQSMNIITALLLLYMDEVEAFFLLSSICEIYMPNYYTRGMLGPTVDVNSFADLIGLELPDVAQHFKKLAVPVAAITMPWFLCLFIGYVPIDINLRILDAFFCEGYNVLFRVGIAIFKVNREYIMKAEDSYSILVLLKNGVTITDEILRIAQEELSHVSIDTVKDNRDIHKVEAIKKIELNARKDKINSLLSSTTFTKEELNEIYDRILNMTHSFDISYEQFSGVMIQFCPFWKDIFEENRYIKDNLWKYFCNGVDKEILSFDELVFGFNLFFKGPLEEKWNVCLQLVNVTKEANISREQLEIVINILISTYNKEIRNHPHTNQFVDNKVKLIIL